MRLNTFLVFRGGKVRAYMHDEFKVFLFINYMFTKYFKLYLSHNFAVYLLTIYMRKTIQFAMHIISEA